MKFIQKFSGMKPPIICPSFWKLQGFYGCLGQCKYCYLRATYIRLHGGDVPRPTLYTKSSLDMFTRDFAKFCQREKDSQLLNSGELGDSFAMEDKWFHGAGPFSRFVIEMFRKQAMHKVLFLTKLSIIDNVLDITTPTEQAVFSFSFNSPEAVEKCGEPNNLAWRIQCSRKLKELGWHVRGRIDPILPFMVDDYRSLIPQLTHLERITLGSLRINNRLLPKTYPTFWKEIVPKMHDIAPGVYRFPIDDDCKAFKTIIGWLRDAGFKGEIGLCKEHFGVWEELKLDWKNPKCNCVL